MSKELKEVIKSIKAWNKANKKDAAACVCSFVSFDEKKIARGDRDITKDSSTLVFGLGTVVEYLATKMCVDISAEKDIKSKF